MITVTKGDKGFNLDFTIQDSSGAPYNIGAYTVTLKAYEKNNRTLFINGACTETIAADGTCYYPVGESDFAAAGKFTAKIELTKTGVIESTETFEILVK